MDVLSLGIIVADIVARPVNEFPEKGKLVLVDDMQLHTGGCAVNTGVALNRLGVSTGIMGKVGNDGFGDFLLKVLKEEGLDIRGVKIEKGCYTSSTMVIVDPDGERRFIHYIGANGKFGREDIDWEIISETQILHVAGAMLMPSLDGQPLAELMKKAKQMRKITSLDTAGDVSPKSLPLIEDALPYVDYFLPSFEEAKMLSREDKPETIAEFFLKRGVKVIGIKMGERGCYTTDGEKEIKIPACKVKVVDTTGAGDAFVGGFLVGVLENWDLEYTTRFANTVGAFCVQEIGASQGIKSREEVTRFLESYR
ncbi:carbohydrate kinase family protein [Candidatus Calescamantes bacterium]|nr:carbohydrate kinase family protein [Candidatus Calescamantes bacterium]